MSFGYISILRNKIFGMCPRIDERLEDLRRITISEVKFHVSELISREVSDSIKKRYWQLDYNTPRSDGGINHIMDGISQCGPCN